MASTSPCNSCVAASALKSASDIQRIHGGRREPSRGRAPALSGSPFVPPLVNVFAKPFVSGGAPGGGSGRGKSRSPPCIPLVRPRNDDGRTTVALLVTPSETLAPSTGFTNVTLDLTSSLVWPLTSRLSTGSSRFCKTVLRKRKARMTALNVLAISLERLRKSDLAASRTRTCSSTCHATTSSHTPSSRP